MAADEPGGIAGIILIQSTFQKEEPVTTGALERIAGDIPVTSASNTRFSCLYRSLLLFFEFLIANQGRRSSAFRVKKPDSIRFLECMAEIQKYGLNILTCIVQWPQSY